MGCGCNDIRQEWGNTAYIILGSKSESEIVNTKEGIRDEIARIMSATSEPKLRDLVPLNDLSILTGKRIYVKSVEFLVYDLYKRAVDNDNGQSTDAFNEIVSGSQSSTPQKMYAHSNFINGMLPINFVDNSFRPVIEINGSNVLKGITTFKDNPIANSLIGIPHNFCWNLDYEITNFRSVTGRASFSQFISDAIGYQNYYVQAIIEIWIDKVFQKIC